MELLEFITAYRRQLIIVCLIAIVMYKLGVNLQKKYEWAENGWFCMGYMLFNLYVPCMLFILLVGK